MSEDNKSQNKEVDLNTLTTESENHELSPEVPKNTDKASTVKLGQEPEVDEKLDVSGKKVGEDGVIITEQEEEEDPWKVSQLAEYFGKPWSELTKKEKAIKVIKGIFKALGVLALLYFFICSLDILSMSLRLLSRDSAGELFSKNTVLKNPIAGVVIGILVTVTVQSSSTSTSVIVSMVSAGILTVRSAIPIVMGSNIGTSVTNTIVSLTQAGDRNQFRRAFAGATIHDMFNCLSTIFLLILEVTAHYLEELTKAIVSGISNDARTSHKMDTLAVITKPFIHLIIQFNPKRCYIVLKNCTDYGSLIDRCNLKPPNVKCKKFMFSDTSLNDQEVGGILLVMALVIICGCLFGVVKLLNSILKGSVARVIKKVSNAKIPHCQCLTGYLLLLVGAVVTFLLQSSSVFTSALTPLVGLGVLTLDVMYPLTLGSNIGTTSTAVIASFASEPETFRDSLQIALCHLFFNISGILIFYPIPFMRWPVYLAKGLGNISSQYRWVAILYIIVVFVIIPLVFLGLSIAGEEYAITFAVLLFTFVFFVIIVNLMQKKCPKCLPKCLQTWDKLPLACRSFQPLNDCFLKCKCCRKLQEKNKSTDEKALVPHPTVGRQVSNISLHSFSLQKDEEGNVGGDGPKTLLLYNNQVKASASGSSKPSALNIKGNSSSRKMSVEVEQAITQPTDTEKKASDLQN